MNMEVICETGPPAYRPYPRRLEIFCHFSPRLKRIIVLVYTHEVISTTIAEKTIQSRFNCHLNSCVEKRASGTKHGKSK